MTTPDYVAANRAQWTVDAPLYARFGELQWAQGEPTWGIWGVPEADLGLLEDVAGRDVLEVGCGTGYVSAWVARRGGRPVGLDPTWAQLESARRFQRDNALEFPLVCGIGEAMPLADATFDVVLSEYGSAIWSDPYRWIPEAARVLRPGGELTFLVNSSLLILCADDDENVPAHECLQRPLRGLHRVEWPDTPAVEFHLSHGDWVRLLRRTGFEVLDLLELYPPADSGSNHSFVDLDWATRWPTEEVWRARRCR